MAAVLRDLRERGLPRPMLTAIACAEPRAAAQRRRREFEGWRRWRGYQVMPLCQAAEVEEVFITVAGNRASITGNQDVIRREPPWRMRDCAILANSGHCNVEIDILVIVEIDILRWRRWPPTRSGAE